MKRRLLSIIFASLLLVLAYDSARAQTPAVYGESMVGYNSHTREIFGYSATWIDYSVGFYYRGTNVKGDLFWSLSRELPLDSGSADGFGFIPAEVLLYSSEYRPVTEYETFSEHRVAARFNFFDEYQGIYYWFNPYGFDNFFDNNFGPWFAQPVQGFNPDFYVPDHYIHLGTTDVKITTPPDPCQNGLLSLNTPCPPTPTPTPTPLPSPTPLTSVQVTEVGFNEGHQIHRWAEALVANQTPIDHSQPTWKKTANPDLPAAYTKGTNPSMFATLTIAPTLTSSKTVKVRVKNGTDIVASKDNVQLSGSSVQISGLSVAANKLETTASVKAGSYTFVWEISYDNGTKWALLGESGPHKVYWTYAAPKNPVFTNQVGEENPKLFDLALEKSAQIADGASTVNDVIAKINDKISKDIYYDPNFQLAGAHPLNGYTTGKLLCFDNCQLLRVLLRGIGIDGTVNFVWGGDQALKQAWYYRYYLTATSYKPSSMRLVREHANDGDGGPNPHFDYHAILIAGDPVRQYDPSYGTDDSAVRIDETFNAKTNSYALGANASSNLVLSTTDKSSQIDIEKPPCSHGVQNIAANPIDDANPFVSQQYLDILNRNPDQGGLGYWSGVITQCGIDMVCDDTKRIDVAQAFFNAGEFLQSNPAFANPNTTTYNGAFVTQCYRSYLRRDADNGGYQFWVSVLNSQIPNSDYRGLLRTFLTSAEYRARFGAP